MPGRATQLSSTADRDSLILELGRDVFAPPQYGGTSSGEHYSPIPFEVLEALKGSLKEIAAKLPPKASG